MGAVQIQAQQARGRSRLWLGALLVVIAIGFARSLSVHGLSIERTMDSPGYEAQVSVLGDLPATLSAVRTPLYPAFLRFSLLFGGEYRAVPALQYAVYALAAILLFVCCERAGFMPWESFLVAAPLGFATVLKQYGASIAPEVIATSLGVIAFGISLILAARGCGWAKNALLSVSIFLACMARPAFLFLAVVCPLTIALITPSMSVVVGGRRIGRDLIMNLLSSCVPLVLYAALRLAVVGNFAIVSFGGIALSGLATNQAFLSEATVSRLQSPEMQGLARAILKQRAMVAAADPGRSSSDSGGEPKVGRSTFETFSAKFNSSVWEVSVPATRNYYHTSPIVLLNPDWVLINTKLSRLSMLAIEVNKVMYLKWVALSVKHAFLTVFSYETSGRLAVTISLVVLLMFTVRAVLEGRQIGSKQPAQVGAIARVQAAALSAVAIIAVVKRLVMPGLYPLVVVFYSTWMSVVTFWNRVIIRTDTEPTEMSRAHGYLAFAVLFFAGGAILTSLVEEPIRRYIIAISPLLPGGILLVAVRWILAMSGGRRNQLIATRDTPGLNP